MAKKKPERRRATNAAKGDQIYPGEDLGSGSLSRRRDPRPS
jgi:hypothetical protein